MKKTNNRSWDHIHSIRRHVKGSFFGTMGFCTSWAVDIHGLKRQWIEVNELDLQLNDLPEKLKGKKIAHLSDLHCSKTVSKKYLQLCADKVNNLNPDMVVLTGDYVTYDPSGNYRKKVVDILSTIDAPLGIYACLGNHDYGVGKFLKKHQDKAIYKMMLDMEDNGINLLRNKSHAIDVDGHGVWLVGFGDIWAKDYKPEQAFKKVGFDDTVLALAHNPKIANELSDYKVDAVFSGHTHGNSVDQLFGSARKGNNFYRSGLYEVEGKKLYVNKGLGRLGRAFFNARPEITLYNLT